MIDFFLVHLNRLYLHLKTIEKQRKLIYIAIRSIYLKKISINQSAFYILLLTINIIILYLTIIYYIYIYYIVVYIYIYIYIYKTVFFIMLV